MTKTNRTLLLHQHEAQALVAGRLEMFWRPVKSQPGKVQSGDWCFFKNNSIYATETAYSENALLRKMMKHCPYGQPGDLLVGKETWRECTDQLGIMYRADGWEDVQANYNLKWRSSATMPRRASRFTLRVVSVGVERVGNISEEDAKTSGANHVIPAAILHKFDPVPLIGYRAGFKLEWDEIYANPRPVRHKGEIVHYESYPFSGEARTEEYQGKLWHIWPNPFAWRVKVEAV